MPALFFSVGRAWHYSVDPKVLASQLNEILAQAHTLDPLLAQELWFALEYGFEGENSSLENWIQTDAFQKILFENAIHGKEMEGSKGASRWMNYEEAKKYIQRRGLMEVLSMGVQSLGSGLNQESAPPTFLPTHGVFMQTRGGWICFIFLEPLQRLDSG